MKHQKELALRKHFKHYLNGKTYYAEDYGHKAWPIGKRKK
jgi:hypothetical protein